MIRTVVGQLARRFKHPLLMGLFLIAVVFLGSGAVAELADRPTAAGLCGVYAVLMATLGAIGYGIVFCGRLILYVERQYGPTGA